MNSDTPPENWICDDRPFVAERIGAQQALALGLRRAAAHRLEQPVGHQSGDGAALIEREHAAHLQIDAELLAVTPPGFFHAGNLSVRLKTDQPRADIDRGEIDHLAFGADRDLRGAAADVDVHHHAAVADRARRRARAVSRHHGFQAVAGADGDELAGLLGEQIADGAGVLPLHRDAGEDQRAGVDLVGIDLGVGIFLLDEGAERVGVDGVLGGVGRQQDVGGVERLALGDDIAAVEPLQHDAREHQMRCRRADVDADAEHDDLVLALQRAAGRGKENAAALVFDLSSSDCSWPALTRQECGPHNPSRRA